MARRKPTLNVSYSPQVDDDLFEIWRYNVTERGRRQADIWLTFLTSKIDGLATNYDEGKPVNDTVALKFITARKRRNAHGHVIVFEIDTAQKAVNILHIFHTSQDWRNKL